MATQQSCMSRPLECYSAVLASGQLAAGHDANDIPQVLGASRFGGRQSSGSLSVQQLRDSGGLGGITSELGQDRLGKQKAAARRVCC